MVANMVAEMVANMEMDMVADMEEDKVSEIVADMEVVMVADMEIDMVADKEVHKMMNEMTMDVRDIVGESRTLVPWTLVSHRTLLPKDISFLGH